MLQLGTASAIGGMVFAQSSGRPISGASIAGKAIFYATSRDGKVFSPRVRVPTPGITTPGHAQLVLMPDGAAAIVLAGPVFASIAANR